MHVGNPCFFGAICGTRADYYALIGHVFTFCEQISKHIDQFRGNFFVGRKSVAPSDVVPPMSEGATLFRPTWFRLVRLRATPATGHRPSESLRRETLPAASKRLDNATVAVTRSAFRC